MRQAIKSWSLPKVTVQNVVKVYAIGAFTNREGLFCRCASWRCYWSTQCLEDTWEEVVEPSKRRHEPIQISGDI